MKNQPHRQLFTANVPKMTHQALEELEPSATNLCARTSVTAPTFKPTGWTKLSSKARRLLRANATDLQPATRLERGAATSCSYGLRTTSTEPKRLKRLMTGVRDDSKPQSCDVAGVKRYEDMSNEWRPSAAGRRQATSKTASTKRGRRVPTAGPVTSASTPLSFERLAAIDAKLASVQRELKQYDAVFTKKTTSISTAARNGPTTFAESSCSSDFGRSTMDLPRRSHQHTTTDAVVQTSKLSRQGNQEPKANKMSVDQLARLRWKTESDSTDFPLSTFERRRRLSAALSASNQVQVGCQESRSIDETMTAAPIISKQSIPSYSKNKPCDLTYLEVFKSCRM